MKKRAWTAEEFERLMELRRQGCHTEDCAALLQRSDPAIRLKLHSSGFSSINGPRFARSASSKDSLPVNAFAKEAFPKGEMPEEHNSAEISDVLTLQPLVSAEALSRDLDEEIRHELSSARNALDQGEIRAAERKFQNLLRVRSLEDRVLEVFASRVEPFFPSERALGAPPVVCQADPDERESAVLLLSDTHIGQIVALEETGGHGDYSVRRFAERLAFLEGRVLELLSERRAITDELVIFFLGDVLHGQLSHGAEREATLLAADQFQFAVWLLYQTLWRLAAAVPKIRIFTVVGNHGRWSSQRKMPTTGRYSNFDWLVYSALQLALRFSGVTNLEFHLNAAPRQLVDVKGSQFLLSHGDHLRGGDKQLSIPLSAITKEVNITAQRHAATSQAPVDYFVMGDKHKSFSLPLPSGAVIANGSFVGTDEFAAYNFPPAPPQQLIFWVSAKYKKTWQYEIQLRHAPSLPELPYELPARLHRLLDDQS